MIHFLSRKSYLIINTIHCNGTTTIFLLFMKFWTRSSVNKFHLLTPQDPYYLVYWFEHHITQIYNDFAYFICTYVPYAKKEDRNISQTQSVNLFWNTVYRLDSKTLATLALVHMILSWLVWAEIKCTVHVALPKRPIKLVETSSAKQKTGDKILLF